MTSSLPLSGELTDYPVLKLISQLIKDVFTGALVIRDTAGTHRAYFLDGQPQGAKLSVVRHPIGKIIRQAGILSEAELMRALERQNKTGKLLGQILLELNIVDQRGLDRVMALQSRLNFLSLITIDMGSFELDEGLVNLTDFIRSPIPPLNALYESIKAFAPIGLLEPFLYDLAFSKVKLVGPLPNDFFRLPDNEIKLLYHLAQERFSGALALCVEINPRDMGALLFALHILEYLEIIPAGDKNLVSD